MRHRTTSALGIVTLLAVVALGTPAYAIPAFARKYGTSCQTCHTVFPHLTPFGEAFRRNGYRFPGTDSDFTKQESVPLGQEAYKKTFPNSVWPGMIQASPPLAFGFNGQALVHPNKHATGAQADNGANFVLDNLVAEAHIWAGGSFDDKNTYWAEVTISGGGANLERAQVLFNDLFGPKHWFNFVLGRGINQLTSFSPHSTYMDDTYLPSVPTTALFGAQGDSFNIQDNYNFAELNGVVGSRVTYNVGISNGQHFDVRPTENAYGHVGVKLGGMAADGEGFSGPQDADHPWAETAVTLDVFGEHTYSYFLPAGANPAGPPQPDGANVVGGAVRANVGSLELSSGLYTENHAHAQADGTGATMVAHFDELSYIVWPWLVPAVRVEYIAATGQGRTQLHDLKILPGVAALVRPNLKLTLVGQIESANGTPAGGWGPVGGMAAPASGSATEFDAITLTLATTF